MSPRVDLMFWADRDGTQNFGDCIGPPICRAVLTSSGVDVDDAAKRRRLWSVGSVMHRTRGDDVVWGSGVNGNALTHSLASGVDVRAVRGPRTAAWLRDNGRASPTAFGDPAMLLPRLFPELGVEDALRERGPIVVVPHLYDVDRIGVMPDGAVVVDPRREWHVVVTALAAARFVVASSLHGLIVAEAFGVPARMMRLSEHESLFKYHDYFESTDRARFTFAPDVETAIAMGPEAPPSIDLDPLLAAFPFDLWRSA